MMITGFYVKSLTPKLNKKRVKQLIRFCGSAWMALYLLPTPALASTGQQIIKDVAVSTFSPGGPGFLIISLLLIALIGWLSGYIAQAAGKGQIAGMIHIVSVFSCISIVAAAALKALGSVVQFLG